MKHLVKNIGSSESHVLGRFEIGPHKLDLVQKGATFKAMLNGYDIYTMNHTASSVENIAVVVEELVGVICRTANVSKVKSSKVTEGYEDRINPEIFFTKTSSKLEGIVSFTDKPISSKNIKVITVPDTDIDISSDTADAIQKLLVLRSKIKELAESCQNLIDITQGVTRRKLVDTMWGASSVQKVIDSIRAKIGEACWNKIDLHTELIDKAILRLISKLRTDLLKVCVEEKKLASEVLIPEVIQNFESLKDLVSQLMTCVAPLISIDEIFRKYTSYPGKFFISDGAVEEIQNAFEDLLGFVEAIPEIESSTIIPLDVFGNKILNELKGN